MIMKESEQEEFRHGTGPSKPGAMGGAGGTGGPGSTGSGRRKGRSMPSENVKTTFDNPADEFRHGVGSMDPVPLGGTGRPSSGGAPSQPMKRKAWDNPSEEFRHGTGREPVMPMGGTGMPQTGRRSPAGNRQRLGVQKTPVPPGSMIGAGTPAGNSTQPAVQKNAAPTSGTVTGEPGQARKRLGVKKSWDSPSDDFRHGNGRGAGRYGLGPSSSQ